MDSDLTRITGRAAAFIETTATPLEGVQAAAMLATVLGDAGRLRVCGNMAAIVAVNLWRRQYERIRAEIALADVFHVEPT